MSAVRLPPALVALTPGHAQAGRTGELERRVRAALEGGLRGVLLREPELEDGPFEALAGRLRALLNGVGGWLGVHDRAHLAASARADAVHLGFRSLAPAALRTWLDGETGIGLSTHAGDPPAERAAADYVFHGPVFATPKPFPLEPVGCAGLRRDVSASTRPVWALGGIEPAQVGEVLASGVRGVAVLSGILPSDDPRRGAAAYVQALRG